MKQKYIGSLFILLITCLFTSCNENSTDDTPNGLSITLDLANNQISGTGGPFTLRIKTTGKWTATVNEPWCKLYKNEGDGSSSIVGVTASNGNSERTAIISVTSNGETQTLTITQSAKSGGSTDPDPDPDPDPTPDPDPDKPSGYAGRIEIPKLKGGTMNIFHTWTTKLNGKDVVTYSYEYDCTKKHVRWVALTFDNVTSQENVKRQDDYKTDPTIPSQYQTDKSDYYAPYNRGHMVASSDRLYSREANSQTFYYSNISPQLIDGFNQGGSTWDAIENKVQNWAKVSNTQDTTYIVKGTSIDYAILATGTYGVKIPKYYFSTILSYKNGQYKAVGFYIEHTYDKTKNIKACAMSIDELEQKTGLDFYHNLPDAIETSIEANYKESDWTW